MSHAIPAPVVDEPGVEIPDPKKIRRRLRIQQIVLVALIVALIGVIVFAFVSQQDRISRGNDRYDALFEAYQELDQDCATADDCTTDAPSAAEVADSDPIPGIPGEQGPAGLAGRDGKDGATPSYSEVLDVVTRFCAANDGCRGPQGLPGVNGQDGSTVVGPSGPSGPAGADGAPGAPGADGRSIASTQCIGEGESSTWQITYSDGSSEITPGPCRAASGLSLF